MARINIEETRAYSRLYYQKNRESILAQKRVYSAENADARNAYMRGYYAENKDARTAFNINWRNTPRGRAIVTYLGMRARVEGRQKKSLQYAGLPLLPRDEFINWSLGNACYLKILNKWKESGYEYRLVPSIDRIDSTRGYEKDNIQWLTFSENATKRNVEYWSNRK